MNTVADKEVSADAYLKFSQFLEQQCGIVLGLNKQYLVRSRLSPLLNRFGFRRMNDLIDKAVGHTDRQLRQAVIDAMTTNETLWFRDNYPFDLLKQSLFEELSKRNRKIRIWSAACSSGQEPYSIAMAAYEYKQTNPGAFRAGLEIVATDLSADMLQRCQHAEYDTLSMVRGLSEERKKRFFEPASDGMMRVIKPIRDMVAFSQINLMDSYSSLGRFDMVFCRNVLIYFSAELKKQILQQIAAALQNDGILFLGASESISSVSEQFSMVRCSPGLYYVKKNQ
ncbi:CheR family methyltransferase [Aestuariibacter salexigens]|uniref:CheR family methyltransferase n=1 Tax=Aestuariibacter salexigens TaxID=226010 RepID=UPI000420643A|nr:protein-glutamate O-methyltransferase CheR [Aestuariibacter salexigens]